MTLAKKFRSGKIIQILAYGNDDPFWYAMAAPVKHEKWQRQAEGLPWIQWTMNLFSARNSPRHSLIGYLSAAE